MSGSLRFKQKPNKDAFSFINVCFGTTSEEYCKYTQTHTQHYELESVNCLAL